MFVSLLDVKESKEDVLLLPAPQLGLKPEADREPLPGADSLEKPETDCSSLLACSKLSQSQASLCSTSSAASIRGDEGGAYSEFYGDYSPLFDNPQDPDNASLKGL